MLSDYLTSQGYIVDTAEDGKTGILKFSHDIHDLIITDVKMPEMSGHEVLKEIKEINFETPVILVTAFAEIEEAVKAIKLGAYDYIKKPFNLNEISITIKQALEYTKLQKENKYLRNELEKKYQFESIIGKSQVMQKIFKVIEVASSVKSAVLITGETGVGKELVARAIHFTGDRRNKKFIPVNCGAIPETLLESELFGYEKGSFTDAKISRKGRFEEADGGTIFLDEICEFPFPVQVKLTRILQDGELYRLGESIPKHIDVRVIAATNKNIEEEVNKGNFRDDLYYRINIIRIHIPPLRERVEDIPLLLNYYLQKSKIEQKKNIVNFTNDAFRILLRYYYPGNVRELQNIVERAVFLSNGDYIDVKDLPEEILNTEKEVIPQKNRLKSAIQNAEMNVIRETLEKTKGNREKTAKILGISERALFYKLKKYLL